MQARDYARALPLLQRAAQLAPHLGVLHSNLAVAHENTRDPERKLRVGYVSADFRTHAAALFLLPLFQHHDRSHVHVTCYSNVRRPDAVTAELRALVDEASLASNPTRLMLLRRSLRRNLEQSPLADAARFASALQQTCTELFERSRQGASSFNSHA